MEHPLSPQAAFAVDRVHKTATQHPEWQKREPFRSVLADDSAAMASLRERDWAKIIFTTTAGMSQAEFLRVVDQWLATAKHPRFDRFYTELVYQPMREVIEYLRINSFKIYVVTGELQEFVRVFARRAYGIPPEQVIGTMIDERYQIKNGKPELIKVPRFFFYGGQSGKAIGIDLFIGERPYAAFGNSTGDRQMLEWTDAGNGARLEMLILHDDRQREYAYGPVRGVPNTQGGTLDDPLLEEASSRGWTVISMKDDWKRIFSFE